VVLGGRVLLLGDSRHQAVNQIREARGRRFAVAVAVGTERVAGGGVRGHDLTDRNVMLRTGAALVFWTGLDGLDWTGFVDWSIDRSLFFFLLPARLEPAFD
jgi:hypothetical protein